MTIACLLHFQLTVNMLPCNLHTITMAMILRNQGHNFSDSTVLRMMWPYPGIPYRLFQIGKRLPSH